MKIVVGSLNPVKINATQKAFKIIFPEQEILVKGIKVESLVSDQPKSSKETLQGALNRLKHLKEHTPDYDYWVGIEGGINLKTEETDCFAWIAVASKKKIGKSKSATFLLPESVNKLLHQGKELGDAMDVLHSRKNVKQSEGAIGILTENHITRTDLYIQPLIIAITQIL